MSKATILADLYKQSVQEYTKTPGEWMGLLSCVAKFYKRSFDNAVLIYAQKPDATQLATFDEWHDKRIDRNINRGAKGIAVIDMANPNASIKYLFDFMDTNGTERSLKNLMGFMWELEDQYRPSLMIKFHEKYITPTSRIEACLYKLVSHKVADILPKYMENFKVRDESSMLYGLPMEAVKAEFTQLVIDSVAYTVFSKCGISTELFEENAFERISHFNSLELFMALGNCTISLARPILKEIHAEIQNIKIERSQLYENRTLNDPELHAGRGRDDVPRPPNLAEPSHRQHPSGQIRQSVEGLHDREPSPSPIGTGGTGQNQRSDTASGRGSGNPQGNADTTATYRPTDAGHRGHDGKSRPHDHADTDRRGNRDERIGDESQVTPLPATQPPTDGKKPSVGGFFVVPPKTEKEATPKDEIEITEQEKQTMSFPYRLLGRLQADCDYFLGAGQRHEKHLWAGSVDAQIAKMRELYNSVREKPEWLTEQDIERYAQQMAASEQKTVSTDIPPIPAPMVEETADNDTAPAPPPTELSDEEITDLVDVVLCADDITADTREWLSEINEFFQGGHKQSSKGHVLKAFYGKLDADYTTKTGEYLHITADEGGLTLLYEGNTLPFNYQELAEKVDLLILHGIYPFSAEDSMIDDYAIPDEVEQMNGATDEPEPEPSTATQMTLFGTFGGSYEDENGEDNDGLLDGNSADPAPLPFAEGDRIFYQDRVYEILKYLHDGRTVEIGDIAQLENLTKFAVTERVPITAITDCKLLQDHYTEGEIAHMVVQSVQSGDDSGDTIDVIKAATIISTVNEQYNHAIMGDFIDRSWGEGLNYRYSPDHHLYDGGPKTKCQNNIAAIRLLKELQEQGRPAMADEQITLAKFVGWGGLANALTPGKAGWEQQYEEIKSLLTDEEFQAAQESTLTAYYTEQSIISHIYKGLERFGFHGGNILDPAMGTGNFYSVLPDSMMDSKLYGSEIEPISGNIAKQLYPNATVQVTGFEHTKHPDHFFDVVVGNVPFNSIKIDDPRYNKHNFRIHDYFLAKSLDKTRPGGIVAVIISKFTMDKANSSVRKYIAQRAELLGAIRLPNNAFKQVAGTEATTDILFLKKREREIVPDEENSPWLYVEENEDGIPLNSYFIDHPEMVLGKMVFDESMFGNEKTTACHPIEGDHLEERLERAVSYLEGSYTEATSEYEGEKEALPESRPADPNVRNYSYTVVDDELYFQENSRMYKQNITGRKAERIRGMMEITHAVRSLIEFQNSEYANSHELPTSGYESNLQEWIDYLNTVYDKYVKEFGALNSYGNIIAFSRDSNAPLLRSIEQESKSEKGVWEKTPMFYRATIRPKVMPSVVHSAEEALKVSLNVKGSVDLPYMSWLYQMPEHRKATPDEIIAELGDRIYQDPDRYMGNPHAGWLTADEYLSGYVKDKLMTAILKAEDEPDRFRRNVDALKLVQPVPLTPEEIGFTLGSTWIPVETYQDFMHETFKTMDYNQTGHGAIALSFSKYSGAYNISYKSGEKTSVTVNQAYGTDRMNAYEILESTLNLRSVEVKDRVEYVDPDTGEDKVKYVLNKKDTILAREKQAEIKMAFESWLFSDPERGTRITKLYNDIFNNIRPREYNGDDLIFPDMSEDVKLRKHQRDVVAHGLYGDGNLLMAHEVGAGKTYAASALAYEFKRLGKCHKPLFAVPNHLVGQWADAYMKLYPNANILVAEKKDFERRNRRRFVSRIATGEYDAVRPDRA